MLLRGNCRLPVLLAGLVGLAVLLGGCSRHYYGRSADKESYKILQEVDRQVFGRTNAFTIETRYSRRDPASIPPAEIIADRSSTNTRVINLEEALRLAVANSREYQTRKEQLYLSALALTGQRYNFSPHLGAVIQPEISGAPVTRLNPDGTTRTETVETGSINSQFTVSQLLKSGGRVTIALGNDLVRYFTEYWFATGGNSPRNTAVSLLTLNLAQPILRGFGINDPAVENLTQAERNVIYQVRSFSLYQQQFAVDTVVSYFSLVTQKDIVRNYYRDFTNRVETTRYLEARAVDRERGSSVDQARSAELGAQRDYINSLASYLTAVDNFKLRLGLPVSESLFLDDRDLEELIAAGITPVDISRDTAFEMALQRQMDLLNAIDQFEDSKRKVRIAADQLKPGVTLLSSGRLESERPDDFMHFDPQQIRYSAGVRVDLPIDRLPERNNYRQWLVTFEAELRSLALTLDSYRERIDVALRSMERVRLNYLNALESLKVAERRVDNDTMSMEAGRATVRDVRESQEVLIRAQNELAVTYASYLADRLNLLLDIGVIDIRPEKFWLSDPLTSLLKPEQKSQPPLHMPADRVLPPEQFLEPAS